MGKRITPTQQYPRFEAMNQKYWGAAWGINQTRHGMIAMMRQFMRPPEAFTRWDQAVAESSDHSFEVETSHYAVEFREVPRLTSSKVWAARTVAHEWWAVIGANSPGGPHPLPLCSKPIVEVDDLSSKILKSVEEHLERLLPAMLARALPASLTGEHSFYLACFYVRLIVSQSYK